MSVYKSVQGFASVEFIGWAWQYKFISESGRGKQHYCVNKHTNHHGNTNADTTSHSLTGGSRTLEVGEVTGGHD